MTSNQADRNQASDSSTTLTRSSPTQNEHSDSSGWRRRGFLRAVSGVAVAGLIAGCTSNGGGENTGAGDGSEASSVEEWLADTSNYASVEDLTGKKSITVEVGAEGNNGPYAFAPAAIKISPRTTVTWKWVNGYHNVVATDGQFKSGGPEQNATFEHAFETAGTALYYCAPHKSMGMKGAVVVAGGDSKSGENTSNQSKSQ